MTEQQSVSVPISTGGQEMVMVPRADFENMRVKPELDSFTKKLLRINYVLTGIYTELSSSEGESTTSKAGIKAAYQTAVNFRPILLEALGDESDKEVVAIYEPFNQEDLTNADVRVLYAGLISYNEAVLSYTKDDLVRGTVLGHNGDMKDPKKERPTGQYL